MEKAIKNYLNIAIIITILVMAFSAYSYVQFYGRSIDVKSFTVSAEGKAVVLPDVAKFSFSVITEGGKNLAELQNGNTKKMNSAIDFVLAHNVEKKDIKTMGYNISQRYEISSCSPLSSSEIKACPPPAIVGYTISQDVQVKARDFSIVGDLLAGVVNNGANSVSQLFFTIDDETMYKEQARKEAIEKAKKQAVDIAREGGFRLGRVVSIQEGGGQSYNSAYEGYPLAASKVMTGEIPRVEVGSNEIRVNISLIYEIQ